MADKQSQVLRLLSLSLVISVAFATAPHHSNRIILRRREDVVTELSKQPLILHQRHRYLQDTAAAASRFSCAENNNPQAFETNLLISHLGDSNGQFLLVESDLALIQTSVLRAYNVLAEASCDRQFRNLTQVVADTTSIQEVPETTSATGEFAVPYKVSGYCNGCLGNARGALFGGKSSSLPAASSGSGSRSGSRSKSSSRRTRVLKGSSSSGSQSKSKSRKSKSNLVKSSNKGPCNCKEANSGPQAPQLQLQINELLSQVRGQLTGEYNVTGILEAKSLTCSSDTVPFASTFLVLLDGEPASLTDAEEQALETAFAKTYNRLSFDQCDDPYFRKIIEVSVDPLVPSSTTTTRRRRRRLQSGSKRSGKGGSGSKSGSKSRSRSESVNGNGNGSGSGSDRIESNDAFNASKVVKVSTEATCHGCVEDSVSLFSSNVVTSERLLQERQRLLQRRQLKVSEATVSSHLQPRQTPDFQESLNPTSSSTSEATAEATPPTTSSPVQPVAGPTLSEATVSFHFQPRQASTGTCYCSAGNTNATGAPTLGTFKDAYNNRLGSDNLLESAGSVEDTVEVEVVSCVDEGDFLETTVFLEVDGRIEELNGDDRTALASGFQRTYNEILFQMCDKPFFRRAANVSIDESSSSSWLGRQPFPATRLDRDHLLRLSIRYACRDCSVDATMFDMGESGMFMPTTTEKGFNQDVQTSADTCFCPLQVSMDAMNNATITLFRDYFNNFLEDLDLSSVDAVEEMVELESFTCGTDTTRRETTLWVEFSSNPYNITIDARRNLEEEMRLAYNNLNFERCDSPHFRTALSFTFLDKSRRQRSLKQNRRNLADVNVDNVAMVSVIYECRDCLSIAAPLLSWTNAPPKEALALNFSEINRNWIQAMNLSDICYCPINDRTEDRSPTEAEFRMAYSMSVGSPKLEELPMERQGIDGSRLAVNDIVEVYDQSCPAQKYAFQTEIYLRLQANVTLLSLDDQATIVKIFTQTYNNLNFLFCDLVHFRRVLQVQLDLPSARRRGQQNEFEEFGQQGEDENLVRLLVDVECRNCTTETTMFSSSSIANESNVELPSSKSSPLLSLLATREAFAKSGSECYCSSTFPFQGRAPTTSEFRAVLDGTALELEGLEEIGDADDVQLVEEVIEVKSVECSEDVSQFTSTVFVGLQGDLDLVTDEEKRVLETTFQDSYNEISFSRCDSFFRNILDVTLVPASTESSLFGKRQTTTSLFDTGNITTNVNSTSEVPSDNDLALYRIVGECRDCPVSDSGTFPLFDDSFRRALTEREVFISASGNIETRHLQSLSGCLCPINTNPDQPADISTDEFLVRYDSAVVRLGEDGTLVNVAGVSDIESCGSEVTEVSGVYEISFSGDSSQLSDEEKEAFIINAFNALRTDVCSAQVVEVVVANNNSPSASVRAEVIAISAGGVQQAVFSSDSGDATVFLDGLNLLISDSGGAATANDVVFRGPAVRCSPNRNGYVVDLVMEYESNTPLSCPPEGPPEGAPDSPPDGPRPQPGDPGRPGPP